MDTTSLNVGCALISTAPVFAAHLTLTKQVRYMLLSWFCSFISTVILVICSLSSLFTKNPYFILLFSVPLDCLGKILLKFFGCRFSFLSNPKDRCYLGMSCGLGFALAHVLTMYLPFVFDQPYSIEFDNKHPDFFPNCLDLALVNQAISCFHIAIGLIIFRFSGVNIFLMYFIIFILQFGIGAMTQIPIIWLKQITINFISYTFLIYGIYSFRSMKYSMIHDDNIKMQES